MTISPLEVLFETPGLTRFELPAPLEELYGGAIGFDEPWVLANFVETIDGVVAIPSIPGSNKLVAAESEADRFVMGLLRACSDALMIGSGTLAASPKSVWTPEQAYPAAADAFAELRERRGRPPQPQVVVLSRSGVLDPSHPSFAAGAIVLTTDHGAEGLAGRLPDEQLVALGPTLDPTAAIEALHARGHRLILSEGGPQAVGPFLADGLVDELFLTVSPRLLGRTPADPRSALVEGTDLLADGPLDAELASVRRDVDHLFLRYRFDTTSRRLRSGHLHPPA